MNYSKPISVPVTNYPLVYKPALDILSIKHGVTELELSTGQLMRLTVHVDGVALNGDKVDVAYNVAVELLDKPDGTIADQHETIQ